ncbi:MAG: SDR family oxidoreductase [Anaerolineae bacterium]|nr:SDR family oxidoreductase [Anaerolineae bacterium]
MRFQQQHVIITGGSSGIGKATAKLLAAQGAHISLIARTPSKLQAARMEIEAARAEARQRVESITADVTNYNQMTTAIETVIEQVGPPDALITCAGMAHPGYFAKLPLEIFEQTMAVNYFGALYAIKAVLPAMLKRGQGHLVLVSSGAGLVGFYGYSPYSPAKFAVRGLAEALRSELKPRGIGVSIVYPPDTDTPQLAAENKTKPPATQRITARAKILTADQVAGAIEHGLHKRTWLITPGLEMSLLARLHSLLLPGLNWYVDRLIARVEREHKDC